MKKSPLIPFNPEVVAKMVSVGRLVVLIQDTVRDKDSVRGLNNDLEVFDAALFLLFGALALTGKDNRSGLVLPKTSSERGRNQLLRVAERNYKEVFKSGEAPTEQQIQTACDSISLALRKLKAQGYDDLSWHIDLYLSERGYVPALPMAVVAARMETKHL